VPGGAFVEVADRCWVARHAWFDVNVSVVGGRRGLLVIDTHASERAALGVAARVRALPGEVVAVVNTHEHFDHTFGNRVLAPDGVPLYAHRTAAARTVQAGERIRQRYVEDTDDPHRDEVLATRIAPATHTFAASAVIDLGDRRVELLHVGRGHTGGDAVVRVADAEVTFAGDLVEESAARRDVPAFGADSYPLEWPDTLDRLLGQMSAAEVVVPGHGAPVDRGFVQRQREGIGAVATREVRVEDALAMGEWPYPEQDLVDAVRRGYAALSASPAS
jgi:glyoxylase-like metal-dependent hydrolase (beta-lactamase superfamily II)